MSFSNIKVNYSNDIKSLHVMIDLQCPNNAGGIAALNSHGKSTIIIIIINLLKNTEHANNLTIKMN